MATYEIKTGDGTFSIDAPDNMPLDQVMAKISGAPQKQERFGERLNREIASIPRQLGLSVRAPLRSVASAVGIVSDPIGGVINAGMDTLGVKGSRLPTATSTFDGIWNGVGLPTPETPQERIVADAAEMGYSGMALPKAFGTASKAVQSPVAKEVLSALSQKPAHQAVSGAASGLAGAYTRETGGDPGAQFLASVAAGVAAPMAMDGAKKVVDASTRLGKTVARSTGQNNFQIDVQIQNALKQGGMDFGQLPKDVQASIRSDVASALKTGADLSPDAVRRLADYRLTGLTPRTGNLTLDAATISQQKNLAKQGINSKDPAAQLLGEVENRNNVKLIDNLNTLGANTADDAHAAGEKVIGALQKRVDSAKSIIGDYYDAARASSGRSAQLDPSAFTQQANNLLDDALLGGKLPGDVRNLLNKAATGEMPLTVDVAEQFKTRIGELQRSTMDKAERKALGLVRQALDNTPLLDGQGQQAIDAFNRARRLNRAWEGIVEKTPSLEAVREGVEPDKFVQQYIIGNGSKASTMDLAMLKRSVKSSPEAMDAIRQQILAHLKNKALSGAADEVGKFSQSSYNTALKAIGERKLTMFFKPEEINQLKALGRVASYEQVQPVGSAVNNSNTASAVSSMLERIANSSLLSKLPFGQSAVAQPVQSIIIGSQARGALAAPKALALPMPKQAQPLPVPAGLLMAPLILKKDEERRGLLSP